ncbi:alpha/beta hydrolase [Paenibacillus sp. SI8]|uniref:alpha/beta hydrolase n=1 Tax=unclassified Paenibacillus TaxID=185978 RepID=UPI003465AE06
MQTSQDLHAELSAIECPALIQRSSNDAAVPAAHAHYAHQHIPNAKLAMLDAWGHLIWLGKGSTALHHQLLGFLKQSR